MRPSRLWCTLILTSLVGCEGSGREGDASARQDGAITGTAGNVTVVIESEDTITKGLSPGLEDDRIRDGWSVTFERYLVAIGDINVHLTTDERVLAEAPDVWVADLTAVAGAGLPLWSFESLSAGRWELHYATPGAAGASRHVTADVEAFEQMVENDWTYWIEGTLHQAGGQSCPPTTQATPGSASPNGNANAGGDECYDAETIAFRFGVSANTTFGPCEVDEMPGFAVTSGGATTVALTIHGDHLFFNGFPEGAEGGIQRLAQWLADCDLDLDGTVTREELERIAPSDLAEIDSRYQLGGSPITPLEDMWDYVTAQLKTQGHFQGEGECPFDGMHHPH